MAQPGMGEADGFEHPGCTVTILDISSMNDKSDQKANRIGIRLMVVRTKPLRRKKTTMLNTTDKIITHKTRLLTLVEQSQPGSS